MEDAVKNQQNKHMPSLFKLRQDPLIQDRVQQQIQELNQLVNSGDSKIKSQRGGVDVFVKHRVKWPHKYVLSSSNKERVSYDQLSVVQWVAGFCRTMKEEKNSKMIEHMLDYLVSLLDDAQDFSWGAAKASHAVLLCRMEQGEINDYSCTDKIDRIRRANAQRHGSPKKSVFDKKISQKPAKVMPCNFFNQNSCSFGKTHETRGVFYRHVCSYCFGTLGKNFGHSELDCRNKNKN